MEWDMIFGPRDHDSSLLLLPFLCAGVSVCILLLHATFFARSKLLLSESHIHPRLQHQDNSSISPIVNSPFPTFLHLNNPIFLWSLSRVLSCVALLALTVFAAVSEQQVVGLRHPYWNPADSLDKASVLNVSIRSKSFDEALCLLFAYIALLSVLTLSPFSRLRATAESHLVVLLFISSVTFAWYELYPLATYQSHRFDVGGWLAWVRVGIISFAALAVPLCTPRPYIQKSSEDPNVPNPEETASIISLVLYSFISPLIWNTYRTAKLDYEQLPPLARYDRAGYLRRRSYAKLDPISQPDRHLFWGMVDVFWKEYSVMMGMIVIKVLAELAAPAGIRYILRYLEDSSHPGYFRPWVWVLWLFFGPIIGAIAMQHYVFITCGMVVRVEAMVTLVLFDHSLRIRMAGDHSSASIEGSAPATSLEGGDQVPHTKRQKRSNSSLIGKIHNLISTDVNNISQDFLFVLFFAPLRVIANVLFLYWILGWSAILGFLSMILLLLVPGKVISLINKIQVEWAKKTDARVQFIVESLNIIRTIKLFSWEKRVKGQSEKKRKEELDCYQKRQLMGLFTVNINHAIPLVVMIVTFSSHTLLFKKPLDASSVFSSIAVFDILRTQLRLLLLQIPSSIQSKVSLDRTNDFLTKTELLDSYKRSKTESAGPEEPVIGFCNAIFTWSSISANPLTLEQSFHIKINGRLLFQRGSINMIIGPTGCGKTSLLMALLGEMRYIPNGANSWVSLPREGGISYAAQEPWIQNSTIRDNILFGVEYDENRYKKVISQCGLEKDLELLELGDDTEVGEKGVNLSGGQKARVSLARAIYSRAEIVILDDVLSSLDVHTSRWIVEKCFCGDLVSGRTLIIVTHNVVTVGKVADFTIALGPGGHVLGQGNTNTVLTSSFETKNEAEMQKRSRKSSLDRGSTTRQPSAIDKPASVEEVAGGHVGWSALKLFFLALGNVRFWIIYIAGFVLANVAVLIQTYWLGTWARAYDTNTANPERVNVAFYLGVYCSICLCGMALYSLAYIVHMIGSIRAARHIYNQLVLSVFAAPLYWLDSTPIGRIISRFTQDTRSIDGSLPNQLQSLTDMTIQLFSRFIAIIIVSPAFSLAGTLLLALGIWTGQVYISAQLPVKRHMSNARSPISGYFHAILAGAATIRAYGAQEMVRKGIEERIDVHTRAARTFWNLNRWIAIRMDALGGLFSASLAAWLIYVRKDVDASDAGFSLNTAVALSGGILWWIRTLNEFQVQTNSLERIHSYLVIPHEPPSEQYPAPPAYWPASGTLAVHNLGAQYGNGSKILHGLSFQVKSGERVGIVGRTGSGKSSLVLALLRMINTTGEIYFDGIETSSISLESLRSNITVVPQEPELASGTIRDNLDPFGEWDDGILWDALNAVGLSQSPIQVDSEPDHARGSVQANIGLDTLIAPSGTNLSLGQRQMVALARAIVRRTKLVILDEATAAIDHETDRKIHHALGSTDQTVLVVAHRLRTVCHVDNVMVLDAGRMVEYGSPKELLRKKGGMFKSLVDGSGERDELYALIEGGSVPVE